MSPLVLHNRYSCLTVDSNIEVDLPSPPIEIVPKPNPPEPHRLAPRRRWERNRVPRHFTIAAISPRSLDLQVELKTTDTGAEFRTRAVVDSGATGSFIDVDFVWRNSITTRKLTRPVPVLNVDGSPNEAGQIVEVLDLILRYKRHGERLLLAVTSLGKKDLLLGYTWLHEHNPEINWETREVKLSRCPRRCSECREEIRAQTPPPSPKPSSSTYRSLSGHRVNYASLLSSLKGLHPEPPESLNLEDEEDEEREEESEVEEGDRVFTTAYRGSAEEVNATSTISQRIAEGFARNSAEARPRSLQDQVPRDIKDYEDVFAKTSFDTLPSHREWDHAIELTGDPKSPHRKLYPLSPSEQTKLDKFLDENVTSGRIRPSKSPLAAPFFFIKKKDGSLRPVQDYRYLNSITVKNKYPLPLVDDLVQRLKGAWYFTKLDVRWGYNNVRIREGDEWKAAF